MNCMKDAGIQKGQSNPQFDIALISFLKLRSRVSILNMKLFKKLDLAPWSSYVTISVAANNQQSSKIVFVNLKWNGPNGGTKWKPMMTP